MRPWKGARVCGYWRTHKKGVFIKKEVQLQLNTLRLEAVADRLQQRIGRAWHGCAKGAGEYVVSNIRSSYETVYVATHRSQDEEDSMVKLNVHVYILNAVR